MAQTENHLVHVGIKAPLEMKREWEQAAAADGRSLSQWARRLIEQARAMQQQPFRKPIHGVPGKKARKGREAA
jgi:hypothetical protein